MIEYTNWEEFAQACIAHLKANNPNYDEEEACAFHTELASHLTVMSVTPSTVNLRMRVKVGETRDSAISYHGAHPPASFFPVENVGVVEFNAALSALPQPTAHCYAQAIDESENDKVWLTPLTYLLAGCLFVSASHVDRKAALETALQTVLLVRGSKSDYLLYVAYIAAKNIYNLLLEWEHQGIDTGLLRYQLMEIALDNVVRSGRNIPEKELVDWVMLVRVGDYSRGELGALFKSVYVEKTIRKMKGNQ